MYAKEKKKKQYLAIYLNTLSIESPLQTVFPGEKKKRLIHCAAPWRPDTGFLTN